MIETSTRILDWIAAGLLVFVFLVLVYGIIYIHDIPYKLAKKRNHPHQDAIHAAGWLSLFLLHLIWPLLWIWALLYKPGVQTRTNDFLQDGFASKDDTQALRDEVAALRDQITKGRESVPTHQDDTDDNIVAETPAPIEPSGQEA
ncbi:DUF3302 domain-containing protein [Desulfovibrio inopinatus]|uniref:DUF3302 domain-containing protein n=1 Tax=Desulfovibrio inopinatus TaxID=102109 RepID=UPI000423581B|nr:DUF3302 domain-containing protein [Desulfovibrio inopinatus]